MARHNNLIGVGPLSHRWTDQIRLSVLQADPPFSFMYTDMFVYTHRHPIRSTKNRLMVIPIPLSDQVAVGFKRAWFILHLTVHRGEQSLCLFWHGPASCLSAGLSDRFPDEQSPPHGKREPYCVIAIVLSVYWYIKPIITCCVIAQCSKHTQLLGGKRLKPFSRYYSYKPCAHLSCWTVWFVISVWPSLLDQSQLFNQILLKRHVGKSTRGLSSCCMAFRRRSSTGLMCCKPSVFLTIAAQPYCIEWASLTGGDNSTCHVKFATDAT